MNAHLESLGRVRLQGILLLAVVFVIGAFSGMALERAREARPGPPPPLGPGIPPEWRKELRLTDAQDRQIHEILERNRTRADAVLDQFLPRLRAVTDSVRAEVGAVLTPDQREMFDRMEPPFGPPLRDGPPPFGGPPPGGPSPGGHYPGGPAPHGGPRRGGPPPDGSR